MMNGASTTAEYVEGELEDMKKRLMDLERKIDGDRASVGSKERVLNGKINDLTAQVREYRLIDVKMVVFLMSAWQFQTKMVVRKLFRIAFALFVKAHRSALHYSRIAFASHFFAFLHFFQLFGRYFTINAPKSCEKCEKNMQKKVQKVRNGNAIQKWNQNSHRTTVTKKFAFFLHCIRIALPPLVSNPDFLSSSDNFYISLMYLSLEQNACFLRFSRLS